MECELTLILCIAASTPERLFSAFVYKTVSSRTHSVVTTAPSVVDFEHDKVVFLFGSDAWLTSWLTQFGLGVIYLGLNFCGVVCDCQLAFGF